MVDTHTHLYLEDFSEDDGGRGAIRRAIDVGVEKMIFPNVGVDTVEPMLTLASEFPENIKCAMGLHPTEVKESWREDLAAVMEHLHTDGGYVAVGEVGIDLYWDKTFADFQMQAFDSQCAEARACGLPLIIHCRDGLDNVLEVLQNHREVPAVFHSFGGSIEDVRKIRRLGDYYFGINGIVTFKNSRLAEVLPEIGIERILLETDSPYLAPVPMRGKRNESSYLPHVCSHIASKMNLTASDVAGITTDNANSLFRLNG